MTHKGSVEYTAGRSVLARPNTRSFRAQAPTRGTSMGRICLLVSVDRVRLSLGNRRLEDHWADFVMAE